MNYIEAVEQANDNPFTVITAQVQCVICDELFSAEISEDETVLISHRCI